ncbi:Hypothetical predicted protein [Pelobates cultripes]|uniref:Uncharacterized protein n=1 Tax=Pelobates cultripes TaxID=61616 RepID=A0AAD1RT81_PELCU|nr:Hypothetical predicted protein [Pelobates cultripes]
MVDQGPRGWTDRDGGRFPVTTPGHRQAPSIPPPMDRGGYPGPRHTELTRQLEPTAETNRPEVRASKMADTSDCKTHSMQQQPATLIHIPKASKMEVKQSGATYPHSLSKMATQPMPEKRSTSLNTHRSPLETFDWLCAGLREALLSWGVTHHQADLTLASWIRPAARRSYYMQIPRASKMTIRQNRYRRASRRDVAPNLPCIQTQQHTRNTVAYEPSDAHIYPT